MGRRLGFFALGWALVLAGGLLAHLVQTAGGVKVEDVRYPGDRGVDFSALLYVPPTASAAHPAPAVLLSHGFINTREMQSPFAIELARRGFVVMAMDMAGHGHSGGVLAEQGFGGPAALTYLRALPYVDKGNIGLEAHSMGGSAVMSAATAMPDAYRSVVLEGSTTAFLGAGAQGTPAFPRNLEVVYGQFDEFAPLMWQVAKGADVNRSKRLMAIFATATPVQAGKLYGDIGAGTARRLINPPIDHPQEHFTAAGVGPAVDWFQRTLTGEATPKAPGDQIWFWKEVGTLAGFIGCVVLILATFALVIASPPLARLAAVPQPLATRRDARWWLAFVVTAALPALTFYPLMKIAPVVFLAPFALTRTLPFALGIFSEQITNQLAVWALGTGVIGFVIGLALGRGGTSFRHHWLQALAAALVSVGMGYLALVVVDLAFKTDFRFWVLALRPLDARHFGYLLLYLPFFAVFFLLSFRAFVTGLPVKAESEVVALSVGGLAMALGFAAMLAAQYVSMALTGLLLTPDEPLNTIIAFQFAPLLAVVGIIAAFCWRQTGDYVPGALVCALFVTWYIVAGTAIFPPTASALAPPAAKAAPANAAGASR